MKEVKEGGMEGCKGKVERKERRDKGDGKGKFKTRKGREG